MNSYRQLPYREAHELKDCITNLQEEINKLTAESTEWESKYYDLQEEVEEEKRIEQASLDTINNLQDRNNNLKEDFKRHIDRINELTDRIDKAIEYIKENATYTDNGFVDDLRYDECQELLNILQGSDE